MLAELIEAIVRSEQGTWFKLKHWWYLRELDKEVQKASLYTTLLGEEVKSYGEKLIADLLFSHGLEYRYEPTFTWGTHQYKPDFSILMPGDDIIVEYWGSDDPAYKAQMEDKRAYWRGRGIRLIEMSHHEFGAGGADAFSNALYKKLLDAGCQLRSLTDEEKAERVFHKHFKKLTKHILKFIEFARVQCLSPEDIDTRLASSDYKLSNKDRFFAEMTVLVYRKFMQHLQTENLYDFPRMLESATKTITETGGHTTVDLGPRKDIEVSIKDIKWLCIDEFQDCSPLFDNFLQSLRHANPDMHIVCVGDDWQAINGYAGSDTKYIESFNTYYPGGAYTTLLTNRRSPQVIVDAGNNIMRGYGEPARWERVSGIVQVKWWRGVDAEERYTLMPAAYADAISKIIGEHPDAKSFAILNRTNTFIKLRLDDFGRMIKQECTNKEINIFGKTIDISTVHKYKGREADVVFIVDVTDRVYPLMHPDRARHQILGSTDDKIRLEERRLFHVAVTRAKEAVYVFTEEGRVSPFIDDLSFPRSK